MLFMLLAMFLLFFCAGFYSIYISSVYEPVGEVWKFSIAPAHEIKLFGES